MLLTVLPPHEVCVRLYQILLGADTTLNSFHYLLSFLLSFPSPFHLSPPWFLIQESWLTTTTLRVCPKLSPDYIFLTMMYEPQRTQASLSLWIWEKAVLLNSWWKKETNQLMSYLFSLQTWMQAAEETPTEIIMMRLPKVFSKDALERQ